MASKLPDYVASAQPVPQANRIPWFSSTAQTYAGIMLWFVFWQDVPVGSGITPKMGQYSEFAGGILSNGLVVAFLGLILAAFMCHFLFYLVPGLLGMKTGLPLYIVGTSTYGVKGGFLMPGFLMGVLQFGWLAVNSFFAGLLLCAPFGYGALTVPHAVVCTLWAIAAAFMGLKGIQYVARVATFFPLIPLSILAILFVASVGGLGGFDTEKVIADGDGKVIEVSESEFVQQRVQRTQPLSDVKDPESDVTTTTYRAQWVEVEKTESFVTKPALPSWKVIALICTYIVGFFATAGAAGTDFGMNNRNAKDVQLGGLVGIALATILAGGLAILIVAGAQGGGQVADGTVLRATGLMEGIMGGFVESTMGIEEAGSKCSAVFMYLLALAAFPPACFSSFIAANSFKTTLPKTNPFVSVGIGTAVAILLAITGMAGDVIGMFKLIGASFGPICGAMAADYLLAGRKWAGPRAGFNPAGWISWGVGFIVGAADFIPGMAGRIPCPPVAAFVVGFVLYFLLAKLGAESETLEMPGAKPEAEGAEA
jgi:cytosine permease